MTIEKNKTKQNKQINKQMDHILTIQNPYLKMLSL